MPLSEVTADVAIRPVWFFAMEQWPEQSRAASEAGRRADPGLMVGQRAPAWIPRIEDLLAFAARKETVYRVDPAKKQVHCRKRPEG